MNNNKSPEPLNIEPALLNISTLARYLGVGRTALYDWLHSEQLPPAAKIINRRRYWTKMQIDKFLQKELK